MPDITPLAMASVGAVNFNSTGDIDYITAADAVYFINTNRPTRNLAARDEMLQSKINEGNALLNAARGSETDLAARLAVSIEDDGTLKASALPDVSAISAEVAAARDGEASLNDKIQSVESQAADAVSTAQAAVAIHEANFEARAEMVRKVTPSGFSGLGYFNPSNINNSTNWFASSAQGLLVEATHPNTIFIGDGRGSSGGQLQSEVVVNGYKLKIRELGTDGVHSGIIFPSAPASGTRQDLVFIESWREEVSKVDGLFFAYGNTQYASSASVDGATLTDTPSAFTGSAYFTASNGVFAVEAASASSDFINNPDHNIGVLENGNYFQVRYRIRVEADIFASQFNIFQGSAGNTANLAPQGQLASVPARGVYTNASGIFVKQDNGAQQYRKTFDDVGMHIGGLYTNDGVDMAPISGLSLDGFTYAVPICAIHRRNTGVYGLDNLNGTAFADSWIVSSDSGVIEQHALNGQSLVSVGGSTFKSVESTLAGATGFAKLVRVSGVGTPAGSATWTRNGSSDSGNLAIVNVDDGRYLNTHSTVTYARPDELYSDIIDRRDVLDLRHKVSLKGDFDEDALYQETFDLLMKGEYRQEWGQLKAFDADGNGTGLIDTGIYGNVHTESLGLGATVPDAGTNTNITRILENNNGTPIGFNGARTIYSDAEAIEDLTVFVEDQADGVASKTHCSEDSGMVSYNATTHAIEIDLTEHSSYVADISKDPTLLSGHKPSIKWGNGADVAGVLTRNSDYNWSFEVKEYGAIEYNHNGVIPFGFYIGSVYSDANGKQWVVTVNTPVNHPFVHFLPDYDNGNDGSVLPPVNGNILTLVSGLGENLVTGAGSVAGYHQVNEGSEYARGYNTAHGTGANESIFATYRVNYKAGSSCLPELPYGDEAVKGASIYLNGNEKKLDGSLYISGDYDKSTKTLGLSGLFGRDSVVGVGQLGITDARGPSVLHDGTKYIMYYAGYTNEWRIYRADSTDGSVWDNHQLILDLGTGGDFDDTAVFSPIVIKAGATWKMWYTGFDGGAEHSVGYATSTDGIAWTKQGQVIAANATGQSQVFSGPVILDGSTYKMWLTSHDGSHVTSYLMTSSDGVTWANEGLVLNRSSIETDWNFWHAHFGSVIKDGSVYRAYAIGRDGQLGIDERGRGGRHRMLLSSDGKNWIDAGPIFAGPRRSGFTDTYIDGSSGTASMIKVGEAYELYFCGIESGVSGKIGRMIFAMSQPGATGSSLTGVYTNTSPQVNLGFKSTDTVVLHYERKVEQRKRELGTELVIPKHTILMSSLGGVGEDLGAYYAAFPKYLRNNADVISTIDDNLVSTLLDSSNTLAILNKHIYPFDSVELVFSDGSWTSKKDGFLLAGVGAMPVTVNGLNWSLKQLFKVTTTGQQVIISFNVAKKDSELYLRVGGQPSISGSDSGRIVDLYNSTARVDLVGRPLVK